MITIIDYGMGNMGSVKNMFKRIGVSCEITSDLDKISKAKKILLPGVGAFDPALRRIHASGMLPVLNQKALQEKIPILGICLGMQLLTLDSEEGTLPGFGWIKGNTLAFKNRIPGHFRIPHMGWNVVKPQQSVNDMTNDFHEESRFYFVHSFFVRVHDENNSLLKTTYGISFDSAVQADNIFGAQFHPEKSHKFGMKFFQNFAKL